MDFNYSIHTRTEYTYLYIMTTCTVLATDYMYKLHVPYQLHVQCGLKITNLQLLEFFSMVLVYAIVFNNDKSLFDALNHGKSLYSCYIHSIQNVVLTPIYCARPGVSSTRNSLPLNRSYVLDSQHILYIFLFTFEIYRSR